MRRSSRRGGACVPDLVGKGGEEGLQWEEQTGFFRKDKSFLGKQTGDKKSEIMFIYAGVSGLSVFFTATRLSQTGFSIGLPLISLLGLVVPAPPSPSPGGKSFSQKLLLFVR